MISFILNINYHYLKIRQIQQKSPVCGQLRYCPFAGLISGDYIDKTGLIRLINETIGKPEISGLSSLNDCLLECVKITNRKFVFIIDEWDALETYINMNYRGLQEDVLRLISGEHLKMKTDGFNNDVESFKTKDDVLTLMIHLGYLAYDEERQRARIPNFQKEIV